MPTVFEDAFIGMNDVLEDVAGVNVTVTRKVGPVVRACDTKAVLGRTVFSRVRQGRGGPSIEFGDADLFIRRDNYRLGETGEAVEPAEGDRIKDNESGRLYEIKPIADEPAWRWHEPEQLTLRIHAAEIIEDV